MNAPAFPTTRMTVPEFLEWAAHAPEGRYELVAGKVIAMSPERVRHVILKAAVFMALNEAIRQAAVPCRTFMDGVGIAIDEQTVREPDCSVQCGAEVDLDSTLIDAPLIVVEVTSPSSEHDDTGAKLVEYFSVPSIRHYLIVRAEQSVVVHHRRDDEGDIHTRILAGGQIELDPPGIVVSVSRLLGVA